ncbi:MAG: HAD family hydrolase [Firmicutes bacterium]|nr:HAD family hydrolase [Bacillota bacterium]
MSFRAVLFDLDGTLLDTLEDLADSMNAVLCRMGFPAHPVESYRYFVGDGMEILVRRALPEGKRGDEETVRACVEAMRAEYGRRWAEKTRPYEGIPTLLEVLRASGILLAILSNKPEEFTRLAVAHFFPNRPFAAVRGLLPGGPRKPDPAGALAIAAELDLPSSSFVYLGDTGTDMETAMAAGMYPVGALWGFRTAEELLAHGAKKLITKPTGLLDLFPSLINDRSAQGPKPGPSGTERT